jgi:hypothetical protein
MITEVIKWTIELIAILLIWLAVVYKRKNHLTPFTTKHWWGQFILIVVAVILIKNIYKI